MVGVSELGTDVPHLFLELESSLAGFDKKKLGGKQGLALTYNAAG